jgi:hypothetical protein
VRRGMQRLALAALALVLGVCATSAEAAEPVYTVKASWGDTHLPPGGEGQVTLVIRNVGDADGSGATTVVDQLPQGVIAKEIHGDLASKCGGVGTETVKCNFLAQQAGAAAAGGPPGPFLEHQGFFPLILIDVEVAPSVGVAGLNVATVDGGGSTRQATDVDQVPFDASPSSFGIRPGSFLGEVFDQEYPFGEAVRQAGAHPYELRVDFDFTQESGVIESGEPVISQRYTLPRGRVRDVDVTLPTGFIGNPEATPKCEAADFAVQGLVFNSTKCPPSTQLGYVNVFVGNDRLKYGYGSFYERYSNLTHVPIYNVVPPKGVPADFAFSAGGLVQAHIYPSLDPAQNYAVKTTSPNISNLLPVRGAEVTFWGVPGDPSHDRWRYFVDEDDAVDSVFGAPTGLSSVRPFLVNPMSCGVDSGGALIRMDSYGEPGSYTPVEEYGEHMVVEGCDDPRIRFEPEVSLRPTTGDAGAPTGLDVHLEVPQRDDAVKDASDLYAQNGDLQAIPTPPIKKAVVTFPEGMTLSPSAAQGLGSCSLEQIGLGTDRPVTCPDSSQYGTLVLHSPILPSTAQPKGWIYLAKQNENPFRNFLSLYLVIQEPERGILVKIPGKAELDPVTGQIKVTFDELPQFPVSDMQMTFKGGVRAGLVNPSTCGQKTIKAEFFSWHDPSSPQVVDNRYEVTRKADGSPCVSNLADRQFEPELEAGTVNNSAGSYSPFALRLTRTDDDQEFSQLGVSLPPGLLANISDVSECSEAGIAQADLQGRTALQEQMAPSCPASSQIGTTDVGAGVGVPLTYVPGKAYLAGPYRGAPLSMVVITPLQVGPYDLGVIAVRSAIRVNPSTAQATIQTDPFPQIYEGIPVRIRDIRVKADRPDTILNPTSCDLMGIDARVTGAGGDVNSTLDDTTAQLRERFQAADCASLSFKPDLRFRLKGGTKRGQFPALQATLRGRPGDANIAHARVTLPRSEFIEQGHIRTVCTRPQFAADACPPGSIYGRATAKSPLFAETLSGPVYLRANGGERVLPDLVVKLNGKIEVTLAGFVDSTDGEGRVRTTFNVIPDAPVTKFTLSMLGGRKGLLVNHLDLCEVTSRANVKMTAHSGKTFQSRPRMGTSCRQEVRKRRKDNG